MITKCAASVLTARYNPFRRSAGSPTSTPRIRANHGGGCERDDEWRLQVVDEPSSREGTAGNEARVPQRDLAGCAHQKIECECADNGDQGLVCDTRPKVCRDQRKSERGGKASDSPEPDERGI